MTEHRLFTGRALNTELGSKQLLVGIALAFAGIAFLVSELMHYLLVPGLGRHSERMIAEGLSALLIGLLVGKLLSRTIQRRRMITLHLQVIEAMNHHIRNALDVILLSTCAIQDKQAVAVISEAVHRIDWTLSEILPRDVLLTEAERENLLSHVSMKSAEKTTGKAADQARAR